MADFKKLTWMRDRLKTTPRVTYEDITPSSGWTEDPKSHRLLVDLPGFKKGDIKLQVDKSGSIAINGGRQIAENRYMQFEKTFKVPEDADIKKISMKFEGDTLEVSIPKVPKVKEEPEIQNAASGSESGQVKQEEPERPMKDVTEKPDKKVKESPVEEVTEKPDEKKEESAAEEVAEKAEEKKESPVEEVTEKSEEKKESPVEEVTEKSEEKKESPVEEVSEKPDEIEKDRKTSQSIDEQQHVQERKDHEQAKDNSAHRDTPQKSVFGKLVESKGILIASILSFTLGVLLTQKLHKPPK